MSSSRSSLAPGLSRKRSLAVLAGFILLAFVPAWVGARFGPGAWFRGLAKPWYNPPGWLFGPVWTTLYVLIGCSGWQFWKATRERPAPVAWFVYALHLVLNGAWTWLFFGLHQPGWALVEIVVLFVVLFLNTVLFHARSPQAGWLLVPTLAWVGFASLLNAGFWALNS